MDIMPTVATTGLGSPVEPLVCRTATGSHSASSKLLSHGTWAARGASSHASSSPSSTAPERGLASSHGRTTPAVGPGEGHGAAAEPAEQAELALPRVPRGGEERRVAGLGGGDGDHDVARVVGADVGHGGERPLLRPAERGDEVPRDVVDRAGVFSPRDDSPPVGGVGGPRDLEGLSFGVASGVVVDDVRDEFPAVR